MPRKLSRRASRIWERLGQWYGSRLADAYGPTPPEDWAELIDRTDDERLEDALVSVRRESPVFPPTLGQLEAAIPKRQHASGREPSKAQQIADLMLKKHGREMCVHQLAQPWNYFGPLREFQMPNTKPPLYITHPDPRGVVVADCRDCGKPTFRVLIEDSVTDGVAA